MKWDYLSFGQREERGVSRDFINKNGTYLLHPRTLEIWVILRIGIFCTSSSCLDSGKGNFRTQVKLGVQNVGKDVVGVEPTNEIQFFLVKIMDAVDWHFELFVKVHSVV